MGADQLTGYSVIGKSVPSLDGVIKATGSAQYLRDIKVNGLLHGKILRSRLPSARIVSIDTSRAEKLTGVKCVITAKDTPQIKFSFIPSLADKLPLCSDIVRYIGDEVAAVAAVSEEIAQQAIDLIEVEYEELPYVFDPEEALKPSAPAIHGGGNNIAFELHKKFGDVGRAFSESDHLFEDRFDTSRVCHCCMETQGCIASYQGLGRLTIWSVTQTPHTLRQEISRVLGIPQRQVRIISPTIGGGFGNRLVMDMKYPIAAILSKKTGRPVRIFNSREEEFETARTRYPYLIELKTGVKNDGSIVAREAKVIVDNGAYNDKGPATLNFACSLFCTLYKVPNIRFDGFIVYTNKQFGTGFRGFGNPQMTFAVESQMDIIAEKLGIDPIELRLMNAVGPGDRTSYGSPIKSCALSECVRKAADRIGWQKKRGKRKGRGVGLAIMVHTGGGTRYYGYNSADAFLKVADDGMVSLVTSAVDIGQGSKTAIAQIAAEELGIGVDAIEVLTGDTDLTPYDLGAYGSRVIYVNGNAVRAAAADAKNQVLAIAAEIMEVSPEDLALGDGKVFLKGYPHKSLAFNEVARASIQRTGAPIAGKGRFYDDIAKSVRLSENYENYYPAFAFGCQAAEVMVDVETGSLRLCKFVAVHDSGTVINLMGAQGQIEGAAAQGIGYALMEELRLEKGRALNPTFADYKMPGALDMCEVETFFIESDPCDGPFGAKGIGEPGLVATSPAIANALYDALGIRMKDIPMTPEKVFKALKKSRDDFLARPAIRPSKPTNYER